MKNPIEKLTAVLFNVCLLLLAVMIPALIFTSSENFYQRTLDNCGMYSEIDSSGEERRRLIYYVGGERSRAATLSNEQLDLVVSHIVDYLSGDKESFELKLDGIYIIGEGLTDGVSLFGERAISHMEDVKALIYASKWAVGICTVTLIGLLAFFIARKEKMKKLLFKYSLAFYSAILAVALLFVLVSLITATREVPFFLRLWKNLHYIIFPFQPDKVRDSELADALTSILSTSFFMNAVADVLLIVFSAVAIWLFISCLWSKNHRKI